VRFLDVFCQVFCFFFVEKRERSFWNCLRRVMKWPPWGRSPLWREDRALRGRRLSSIRLIQPAEAIDAKLVVDRADVTAFTDWLVCYVAMCCEADFEDRPEAAHLKRLETTDLSLCDAGCPTFGTVEECCEGGWLSWKFWLWFLMDISGRL